VASQLTEPDSGISMSSADVGTVGALYVAGVCLGALLFGQLKDRYGRKKLFMLTLAIYLVATVATAFTVVPWYFFPVPHRCRHRRGILGDQFRHRRADPRPQPRAHRSRDQRQLLGGSRDRLYRRAAPADIGWRITFAAGAVIGLGILLVRRHVPESPRWLFLHGRVEEAERVVDEIEAQVQADTGAPLPEPRGPHIVVRARGSVRYRELVREASRRYPQRAVPGLALFIGQAFLYDAVAFDLGTILSGFFGVASASAPYFMVIFAASRTSTSPAVFSAMNSDPCSRNRVSVVSPPTSE
jgi:MFS family permease